jgi:hypothetical protein
MPPTEVPWAVNDAIAQVLNLQPGTAATAATIDHRPYLEGAPT